MEPMDNIIDHSVLDVYESEKLWKQQGYWYALLEQYFFQQFFMLKQDVSLTRRIVIMAKKRREYILDTTYAKNGTVTVKYRNPLRRLKLWLQNRITPTTM